MLPGTQGSPTSSPVIRSLAGTNHQQGLSIRLETRHSVSLSVHGAQQPLTGATTIHMVRRAGVAQQLAKTFTALVEDLSLGTSESLQPSVIPAPGEPGALFWPPLTPTLMCVHTLTHRNTNTFHNKSF